MNIWRDILDSLDDAVVALSPDFEVLAVNAGAETLVGISPLSTPLFRDLIAGNEWLQRMVRSCLANHEAQNAAVATLVMGDRELAVRAEVSPNFNPEGAPDGVVILVHDLSRLQEVEHTAEENEETALGLSPAGLAHEIKNPLTGIKGAAELLAVQFPQDPRAQQYCNLILNGVGRIAALVEQVLSVSGPSRLKHEPVNIHRVLHQSLALAGLHPAPPTGVRIEQEFDPSLPEISGDAAALERVFLNLLRNAAEAIGTEGTIRLRTRIQPQFRRTPSGGRRRFLRVEISDSGPGMAAAELPRLFTPFYTTKPQGTGLGLVLSRRIVALHGGRLWAEAAARSANQDRAAALAEAAGRQEHDRSRHRHRTALNSAGGHSLPGLTFKITLPIESPSAQAQIG